MCIRDSVDPKTIAAGYVPPRIEMARATQEEKKHQLTNLETCLLYTSDAADERSSVDLGGRRIIKKKKQEEYAQLPVLYTR